MFLAKEVAEWIEYDLTSVNKLVNLVDDDEKVRKNVPTLGGMQEVWMLTEDGLYEVLFQSRKPIAKQFKKGVKEILKSIRRTGEFHANEPNREQPSVRDKIAVAKFLSSYLNLNDSSKLIIAKSIADPLGLPTPDYTPSKGILKSASELLEERGLKSQISAQVFNKKAIEKGYLCELERNSTHGKKKPFKSITNKGLSFGENQVNTNNPKSTQPLWYDEKFGELLGVLGFQLTGGLNY